MSTLRCAIYIRVSTEEQNLNGLSLPAQRQALTEYAKAQRYQIVDVYADEGISARKSMKNRKELLRLLEDVRQNKIDMILVTKLDRWFRNIKDYNITEEILQAHNCHWKTIFENYDSSTANGQMVINIMLSVNQAECDRTSERIKAVFDYKRANGQVTSGMCAPYGYTVKEGHIIKDPAAEAIINDAYTHYFTCFSRRQVIAYLQEKYGPDAPSANKIDKLFINEKYCGRFRDNDHYCEPYISPDDFQRIRQITQSKLRPKTEYTYIFSSLLVCPVCGRKLTGKLKKQKLKDGSYTIYPRYTCMVKFDRHPAPCISESVVEQYMIDHVLVDLMREKVNLQTRIRNNAGKNPYKNAALQQELSRLNSMYQKGRISEEFYDQEYERLETELKQLDQKQMTAVITRYSRLIKTFSGNWLELYHELDNEHKRTFWKSVIKEIHIDKETRKLCGFEFLI